MKPSEYNKTRTDDGTITWDDWSLMVREYQTHADGLVVDGKCGPKTLASLRGEAQPRTDITSRLRYVHEVSYDKVFPLPIVRGHDWEEKPQLTSDHYLKNPSRAPNSRPGYQGHQGQDFLYRYNEAVHPPKRELPANRYDGPWWVPKNVLVYAAAKGRVVRAQHVRNEEWVVRIQHPDKWMTQYRHLESCDVRVGDSVTAGQRLGLCGGLNGTGLVHLHIEVYRSGPYVYKESMYPKPFFEEASYITQLV